MGGSGKALFHIIMYRLWTVPVRVQWHDQSDCRIYITADLGHMILQSFYMCSVFVKISHELKC